MEITYTVVSKKDELLAGTLPCQSPLDALLKSKEILRETRKPAVITEITLENNKMVSHREVKLKVIAEATNQDKNITVSCDNCLGSGTTDELNTCSCTFCEGKGTVQPDIDKAIKVLEINNFNLELSDVLEIFNGGLLFKDKYRTVVLNYIPSDNTIITQRFIKNKWKKVVTYDIDAVDCHV